MVTELGRFTTARVASTPGPPVTGGAGGTSSVQVRRHTAVGGIETTCGLTMPQWALPKRSNAPPVMRKPANELLGLLFASWRATIHTLPLPSSRWCVLLAG